MGVIRIFTGYILLNSNAYTGKHPTTIFFPTKIFVELDWIYQGKVSFKSDWNQWTSLGLQRILEYTKPLSESTRIELYKKKINKSELSSSILQRISNEKSL